jgi:pyridinium-3,5-bisthiocarboxylic acid mononucleotide nickel chelatase
VLRLWLGEQPREKAAIASPVGSRPQMAGQPGNTGVSPGLAIAAAPPASIPGQTETLVLLQTQLDDLSPQAIGYVMEQLLALGALDVFTQAIGMKKNRPGVLLTVVCRDDRSSQACERLMFQETSTLGIRRWRQERRSLARTWHPASTPYGTVRVKVAWDDTGEIPGVEGVGSGPDPAIAPPPLPLNVQPEYEDCAALARQHQIPWQVIHRLAIVAWYTQAPGSPCP